VWLGSDVGIDPMSIPTVKDVGVANPCPLCGVRPVVFENGEYDGDFLYPILTFRLPGVESCLGHSQRLVHAVCHESAGGCGHIAIGFSYQGAVESWNSYHQDPSLQVRFDLPLMEAAIKKYGEVVKEWFAEQDRIIEDQDLGRRLRRIRDHSGYWEQVVAQDWSYNHETLRAIKEVRDNAKQEGKKC